MSASTITLGGYSTPVVLSATSSTRATPSAVPEAAAAAAAAVPSMVCTQEFTAPVAAGMTWRVWRALNDRAASYEPFHIQAATLAEAVQLERVLEAFGDWHDCSSSGDIQHWDGISWEPISREAADAALALLHRVWALDDIPLGNQPCQPSKPQGI